MDAAKWEVPVREPWDHAPDACHQRNPEAPIKKNLNPPMSPQPKRKAEDPAWPLDGKKGRASPSSYSMRTGQLVVTRQAQECSYPVGQNQETIASIVAKLALLLENRRSSGLDGYDEQFFRYLTAMMGSINTFLQDGRGGAVSAVIQDYRSRDDLGFKHDEAGRAAWRAHLHGGGDEGPHRMQDSSAGRFASPQVDERLMAGQYCRRSCAINPYSWAKNHYSSDWT